MCESSTIPKEACTARTNEKWFPKNLYSLCLHYWISVFSARSFWHTCSNSQSLLAQTSAPGMLPSVAESAWLPHCNPLYNPRQYPRVGSQGGCSWVSAFCWLFRPPVVQPAPVPRACPSEGWKYQHSWSLVERAFTEHLLCASLDCQLHIPSPAVSPPVSQSVED